MKSLSDLDFICWIILLIIISISYIWFSSFVEIKICICTPVLKSFYKIIMSKAQTCHRWAWNASCFLSFGARIMWYWRVLTPKSRHKINQQARFALFYFLLMRCMFVTAWLFHYVYLCSYNSTFWFMKFTSCYLKLLY